MSKWICRMEILDCLAMSFAPLTFPATVIAFLAGSKIKSHLPLERCL